MIHQRVRIKLPLNESKGEKTYSIKKRAYVKLNVISIKHSTLLGSLESL